MAIVCDLVLSGVSLFDGHVAFTELLTDSLRMHGLYSPTHLYVASKGSSLDRILATGSARNTPFIFAFTEEKLKLETIIADIPCTFLEQAFRGTPPVVAIYQEHHLSSLQNTLFGYIFKNPSCRRDALVAVYRLIENSPKG